MSSKNKIFLPNTTATPNIILDYWMAILSSSAFKVIMFVTRETFGYGFREETNKDYCSINLIAERTGLNRDTVINSIKELCEYELIIKIPLGKANNYKINIYDPSQDGNTDLTSQVGEADLNRTDKPTLNLQPHTYNTNQNKSVCVATALVEPPPLLNHEKIKRCKTDGTAYEVSFNDLIHQSIRMNKDWTMEELEEVWRIITNYDSPINDWFKFCEATILNQRKMSKIKTFNKKEKECHNKKLSLKEKLPSNKKESSAQDSWGRPLENWKSQIGQVKK